MPLNNPIGAAENLKPNRKRKPTDPKPPPGTPGGGRKKGTLNRTTKVLREAILESFDKVGGVKYLVKMASQEPRSYMALLAKVLPAKIEAEVTVTAAEVTDRLIAGRQRVAALRSQMEAAAAAADGALIDGTATDPSEPPTAA